MLVFKIDVNLQKLSLIAIAAGFWEPRNIKNEIRKFFEGSEDKSREMWINSVASYVAEQVDFLVLPEKLKPKIKNYVFILGGSIFNFIHHVTKNGFDIDFGLNIIWTSYGRIDEVSMAKRSLIGHCDVEPLPDCYLSLADIYTDKDLVRVNMRALRREEKTLSKVVRKKCDKSFLVAMTGHRLYRHKKFKCFNSNEYKFLYCFLKDGEFPFPAKYFWNYLSDMEKEVCVLFAAEKFHSNCYRNADYLQQKHAEALMFFMTQMNSEMGLAFILSNFDLFRIYLETWPLREFCVNIVNTMNCKGDLNFFTFFRALDLVTSRLLFNEIPATLQSELKKYDLKNDYHVILEELLKITPDEIKVKYFQEYLECFFYFHQNSDYMTISIIANDDSLKELKDSVICTGESLFKDLLWSGDSKEINRYVKLVLLNDKEKRKFETKLSRIKEKLRNETELFVYIDKDFQSLTM